MANFWVDLEWFRVFLGELLVCGGGIRGRESSGGGLKVAIWLQIKFGKSLIISIFAY